MFVKKGDKVRVIAGKDKGVEALVVTALPKVNKVVVEGVNIVKKHQKPNQQTGVEGGIIEKEAFLHISNVAIYNAATQKADRISYQLNDEGKKQRVYRSSGEVVATA